ncbi:hypothetical protein [Marinifilum sp.]|uniref:hypothetical protein n=1 Tax=Marinifilum sp. TaxID=2033137 RepID=UPI003BA97726
MKTIINRFLLIFLTTTLLLGCSDEDNPFKGDNAHVISFALTVDGVKYPASIAKDEIIITVPQNINLSAANADYTLSENASLQPDPKTVNNWNEEQIFRVNAWNNEFASYKYTVHRTDVVDPDNVVLLTQADLVEFAKKGITKINGNLIIGHTTTPSVEFDTIKDLTPLSELTTVDLNIVINSSATSANFGGLSNINYAGGIYLGSIKEQANAIKVSDLEFYNLEQVNQLIINSDSIQSLSFPKLNKANEIYINSKELKSINFSSLEECTADFSLKAVRNKNYQEINSNTSLRAIKLPELNHVGGKLWIENFWEVKELNLSKLKKTGGDLQLQYIRSIPKIDLPELTSVGNLLNIKNNDGMTEFYARKLDSASSVYISSLNIFSLNLTSINLPALRTIEEDFTIRFASSIKLEFPELNCIKGELSIESTPFLESISLPNLNTCNSIALLGTKSLSSFENPNITNLSNLKLVECSKLSVFKTPPVLSGDVNIDFRRKTYDFPTLKDLEEIKGVLDIRSCYAKTIKIDGIKKINKLYINNTNKFELVNLLSLEEIDEDLEIISLQNLTSLSAPDLTTVGNNFSIKGCTLLTDIKLPKLTNINGQLNFFGGNNKWQASRSIIENMDAFSALSNAGSVEIKFAGKLKDFSGLKNVIGSLTADKWTVQDCLYNPDYTDMKDGKYSNN